MFWPQNETNDVEWSFIFLYILFIKKLHRKTHIHTMWDGKEPSPPDRGRDAYKIFIDIKYSYIQSIWSDPKYYSNLVIFNRFLPYSNIQQRHWGQHFAVPFPNWDGHKAEWTWRCRLGNHQAFGVRQLLYWGGSDPFSRVEMDIGWQALRLKIVLATEFVLMFLLFFNWNHESWIRWGKKIGKLKANPSQLTELTLPQSIMATIFEGQMLNATCLLWTLFKLVVAVWKNVYLHVLIYIYTLYYVLFIYIYISVCFFNMNIGCVMLQKQHLLLASGSCQRSETWDTWRNCSSFAASKGRSPRATMKHGCVILARESIVYRRGSSESGRKGIAHKQTTEGSVWLLCWFIGMFPQPSWSCHYPNVGDCMGPYHKLSFIACQPSHQCDHSVI